MSVTGRFLNWLGLKITHGYQRKHGATMMYDVIYEEAEPFKLSDWKAPKGYRNSEVALSSCRAFLLEREGREGAPEGTGARGGWMVYHLHGGAYITRFTTSYNDTAVRYSECAGGADVFSLDYRTAPKDVYPCALDDALEGYRWLLEHGREPSRIIVCGDSAGGGLALSLCMRLRELGLEEPAALVLSSPWADLAAEGESYTTKITSDVFFGSWSAEVAPRYPVPIDYAGEFDPHEPGISPVYGSFTGMPPMLIQTGENELLLSDSQTVADKAREAGVDARLVIYPLMCHTFYISFPGIPESREAWDKIRGFCSQVMGE